MKKILLGPTLAVVIILLFPLFFPAVGIQQSLGVKADSDITRKAEFTQLWNYKLDKSFVASPVSANGLVYVTSVFSGGSGVSLICLNASSGTQVWNHTGYFISFSVANGYIYVNEIPESNLRTNFLGVIVCLNAYTGSQIWKFTYGSSRCAPIVVGNYVYVCGYAATYPVFDHGFVYALDALTGDVMWSQTINGVVFYATVSDGLVFVNFINENYVDGLFYAEGMCAFDALTGERIWTYPVGGSLNRVPDTPPIIFDDKIYVSYNNYSKTDPDYHAGGVYALDALNGKLLWNFKTSSSVGNPLVADGICYVVSGDSFLTAFDASDGTIVWNYAAKTNLGSLQSVNGSLFAGSSAGVFCFDASDGTVIWNFAADEFVGSSATCPVYAEGVIYVGWNGPQFFSSVTRHDFYALDALTGEKIGNYTLGYAVKNSPTVMNSTIYIGASSVTEENPDWAGPGAVIALNSTITLSPSISFSASTITLIAVGVIAAIAVAVGAGLLVYFKKRKRVLVAV